MAKALVVYYSRTGYTLRVAEKMAAALGADLERIEDAASRRGVLGYLRCAREALRKRAAVIRPPAFDPAAYDLVVVGGPVWAGNVASPVRAYLQASKGHIAHFACFCTQGGSGGPGVLAAMAALTGLAAEATLVLGQGDRQRLRRRAAPDVRRTARIPTQHSPGRLRLFATKYLTRPRIRLR